MLTLCTPPKPTPEWLNEYQEAKDRFDQALHDIHSTLLTAPQPLEYLSLTEKVLTLQIRRSFGVRPYGESA